MVKLIKEGNDEKTFIPMIQSLADNFEQIAEYIEAQGLNEREEQALVKGWDSIKSCYSEIDGFMK